MKEMNQDQNTESLLGRIFVALQQIRNETLWTDTGQKMT